ncbi:MAG: hypothetical protein AAGA90_23915 [Actinomycetota bacterium]
MDAEQIAEMIHDAMIDSDVAADDGLEDVRVNRDHVRIRMTDGAEFALTVVELER